MPTRWTIRIWKAKKKGIIKNVNWINLKKVIQFLKLLFCVIEINKFPKENLIFYDKWT